MRRVCARLAARDIDQIFDADGNARQRRTRLALRRETVLMARIFKRAFLVDFYKGMKLGVVFLDARKTVFDGVLGAHAAFRNRVL